MVSKFPFNWVNLYRYNLVFIPCGIPHAVQNRGEMLAVGWFSSGFAMSGTVGLYKC
jgi:hypothetical protein